MGMGGSNNGMVAGLKAGTDNSPVYGTLTRIDSNGKIVPNAMAGGAPTPGYTNAPISPNIYQPDYSKYQQQASLAQPQYQQLFQQMPDYQSGLQAAMEQMMQQYNRPMMREPIQQGLTPYRSDALNYRPDTSGITSNLNRVAPSVAEQQRLAAEQAAREKAEKDAYDAANPPKPQEPAYDSGGGG
jgi:hypothetical protein